MRIWLNYLGFFSFSLVEILSSNNWIVCCGMLLVGLDFVRLVGLCCLLATRLNKMSISCTQIKCLVRMI